MKKIMIFSLFLTACGNVPVNIPKVNKPIYDYEKSINDIAIGMSKSKVISILGQPLSTEANNNKECLTYHLTTFYRERFSLLFVDEKLRKYNKTQKCVDLL